MKQLRLITPEQSVAIETCGAKAYHLAILFDKKFAIPATVFIPVSVYFAFIEHNRLAAKIAKIKELISNNSESDVLAIESKKLQSDFIAGEMPESFDFLFAEVLEQFNGPVAIRSSAVSEDEQEHSFAGQYASILNVAANKSDLIAAVKKVWASQWNEALVSYLQSQKIETFRDGMAIIVQQMVNAKYAGVLFSRNPNNINSEQLILEYVEGLAEDLVSGNQNPVHLQLNRKNPGLSQLPEESVDLFKQLLDEALQIESIYGRAVDIEWAIDAQQLYFLQFRPLTTGIQEILWTNENVGEVIPDVVTPASWSILKPVTNNAFKKLLKILNIKNFPKEGLFDLYKGKVYFNNTQFNMLLSEFYISEKLEGKSPLSKLNFLILKIPVFVKTAIFVLTLGSKINRHLRKDKRRFDALKFESGQNSDICLSKIKQIIKQHSAVMFLHIAGTIFAELYYQLLVKLSVLFSSEKHQISADILLSGNAGAESAATGRALWQLAQKINSNETVKNIFLSESTENINSVLKNESRAQDIIFEIDSFVEQFGHSALHEFELIYPRWWEDRTYIYSNLKSYLENITEYDWQRSQQERVQNQQLAYQQALKNVPLIVRFFYKQIYKKARFFAKMRENLKQAFVRLHSELKKYLLEIAKHLNLPHLNILYLNVEEIEQIISGLLKLEFAQNLIEQRIEERQQNLKFEHPEKIKQVGPNWYPVFEEEQNNKHIDFNGIPCSAGIIEARVRIVLDAEQFNELQKGEILVTRATNPGWTPLFVLAAGLITEIGGALSHGAIIAREYGLPMVAAVSNITKQLKTGQKIRLNGFTGEIEILNEVQ